MELARRLTRAGHEVLGVRRSSLGAVRETGADAAAADATDRDALAGLPATDAVVFAASSGGRGPEAARAVYVEGLRAAIDAYSDRPDPPERLLYTSSTSVYGDHGGDWADEDTPVDPTTEKAEVLAEAERVAREEGAGAELDPTVAASPDSTVPTATGWIATSRGRSRRAT